MAFQKVLVTGSCGLVGSEAVRYFCNLGAEVHGFDDDSRGRFYGPEASVASVRDELSKIEGYKHYEQDCLYAALAMKREKPDLIIHCAGQPSHEWSGKLPYQDFVVNTTKTVELLEATRLEVPKSPFVFMSTSKVYNPNVMRVVEKETRFEWANNCKKPYGMVEWDRIDRVCHTPYGASKLAADLIVQEYGYYYEMPTVCLRCSCIIGEKQKGVALHGYLSHLCKCALEEKVFTIYGYKGKQVRDNLHVSDLINAIHLWAKQPIRNGDVFNMGGGFENACSLLEAIQLVEGISGKKIATKQGEARKGDHIVYYANTGKFQYHYPEWKPQVSLKQMVTKLLDPTR